MSEDAPLLAVRSLSVDYGGAPVVHDVSFDLARGRCLGVIGESGAGKSQTFMAMLGLLPAHARVAGAASFDGVELLGGGARALRGRRIGMIFQDPMTALTPHLTVGDQIAEPLVAHRGLSWSEGRARAADLLAQVRVGDVPRRLRQYPHELSGGMRQRVTIAAALACDPELLIADEPTTALDVSVQAQLLALLRQLVEERRMSLVVVTHDMGVIAALADDVVVMRTGRLVEEGAVAQILGAPRHEYTRTLLAASPRLDGTTSAVAGVGGDPHRPLIARDVVVRHRLRGGWRAATLTAVDGVSFDVSAGEAVGIVGESGSGKSSLARAVLRLTPIASGEIVWLGRAVQDLDAAQLRPLRVGTQIVFQDPLASLDPVMTVADVVAEPLRALRPGMDAATRRQQVLRQLDVVGLDATFAPRYARELSGGQCQRVAIARAMVLEPKLLVCDEAVSALDVSIQAQVLALLAEFKRRGVGLVFVSHNLAVVRQLCERVLVMYLGRIVEAGPAATVLAAPRHPYTRRLLEAVPRLDPAAARAQLAAIEVEAEDSASLDRSGGCAFRARCPHAQPACAARRPEPETVENSHQVACLRWRELRS
jgi:peptide/nickel transport system ATP-binding protein